MTQMWNEEEDAEYNSKASAAWHAVKLNAEQTRHTVKEEAEADDDGGGGAAAQARFSQRGQPFCQVCAAQGVLFCFSPAVQPPCCWQKLPPPSCALLQPAAGCAAGWLPPPNAVGRRVGTPNLHAHRG